MAQSRDSIVDRIMTRLGNRRSALSAASLAAVGSLGLGNLSARAADVSADGKKRGRRGKRGKQGPAGPPSGANATVVTETCDVGGPGQGLEVGDTAPCEAVCDDGFVAVGGGFVGPTVIDALGQVVATRPNAENGAATGWETTVEFIDLGQSFSITTYVVCLPA